MYDFFTIYEDKSFKGKQFTASLGGTPSELIQSLKSTQVHDNMSSVKWSLSGSRKVVFYEDTDGNGRQYVISGVGSDSDTHDNNFKDCASAWRLLENNSFPLSFFNVPTSAQVLKFSHNGVSMPSGGHMQGIAQLDSRTLVISGSSDSKAYFFIVEWPVVIRPAEVGQVIKVVHINDHFPGMRHNHASGIQLLGNILAVGAEQGGDPNKSTVVFFDLTNRSNPVPVGTPIFRQHETAGAVGIIQLSNYVLLAVGGWDSNVIDFYCSNTQYINSGNFRFDLLKTWRKSQMSATGWIDGNFGAYQGLNLFRQSNGKLYMVGFNRNSSGQDWADLYSVDLNLSAAYMLKKVDKKHVYCQDGASFRYGGGGIFSSGSSDLTLYAVEADLHTQSTINRFT